MSLDVFVVAVVLIVVGLLFTFQGVKAFFVLLPFWAFVAGFAAGSEGWSTIFGEGFLATTTGWIVGAIFGVALAVLSYFWYWAAVVILFGSAGYMLGIGLMQALGIDSGVLSFLIGLALGVVFAIAAILLHAPAYLAIGATALLGAAATIVGVWLLLGRLTVAALAGGLLDALSKDSLAVLLWLVLALVGIAYQYAEVRRMRVELMGSLDPSPYRYA
jgi:hypothetical protein